MTQIEAELFQLCQLMIKSLDKLYLEGRITREEYLKHTQIKMEFIENKKGTSD